MLRIPSPKGEGFTDPQNGTLKKRNQHHVWQHYLRSWTLDGAIRCLSGGRIFTTGTPIVAMERDFYRLHDVTAQDIAIVRWLVSEKTHPLNRKLHDQFLAGVTTPVILLGDLAKKDKLVAEALDTFMTNALEDVYAGIERQFLPLLERIKSRDIGFFADGKDALDFVFFICTQYMRTKAIRVRTLDRLKQNKLPDLTRVWNLLGYLFAINVGFGLYQGRRRRQLVLIENSTEIPFITGDQPVTNLLGSVSDRPPEVLILYYPITPSLALVLSEEDREPPFTEVTAAKVLELNERIWAVSHRQVFASSELPLKLLQ